MEIKSEASDSLDECKKQVVVVHYYDFVPSFIEFGLHDLHNVRAVRSADVVNLPYFTFPRQLGPYR